MKKVFLILFSTFIVVQLKAQIPTLNWINAFDINEILQIQAIETDQNGDIIIAGMFKNTVDIDPSSGVFNLYASSGVEELFVAKYTSSGSFLWAYQLYSAYARLWDLKINSYNEIYILGSYVNISTFGSPDVYAASSSGSFLLKISPAGTYQDVKTFVAGTGALDIGNNDEVLLALALSGFNDVDFSTDTVLLNAASLIRYSRSGDLLWYYTFQATQIWDVHVGKAGNIFISGQHSGIITPDPNDPGYFLFLPWGGLNHFLIKLDSNYDYDWIRYGSGYSAGQSIEEDQFGNVYDLIIYHYTVDLNFTGPSVIVNSSGPDDNLALIKYDKDGNYQWSFTLETNYTMYHIWEYNMILDPLNKILISGRTGTGGTIDFDPSLATVGGYDNVGFLAAYDSLGTYSWSHLYGTTIMGGFQNGMYYTKSGKFYTTGHYGFASDMDLTLTTYTPSVSFITAKFFASYSYCHTPPAVEIDSASSVLEVCPGDTATINTFAYGDLLWSIPGSGDVLDVNNNTITYPSVDSTVTIQIQDKLCLSGPVTNITIHVLDVSHSHQYPSICNGGSFTFNGNTYSASGEYLDTLTNILGCDSIIHTHLFEIPDYFNNAAFICPGDSITIGSNTYSLTGNYIDSLISGGGCDSVIHTSVYLIGVDTSFMVSSTADTIFCTYQEGAYQWINCNDSSVIIGANNFFYVPTASGNYAVIVDYGSCQDTTNCINFAMANLNDLEGTVFFEFYPNPSNGDLIFKSDNTLSLNLLSTDGRLVSTFIVQKGNTNVHFDELESGVYFVGSTSIGFRKLIINNR